MTTSPRPTPPSLSYPGAVLRRHRRARRLSITACAAPCAMSWRRLQYLEVTVGATPTPAEILALARVFDLTVEQLVAELADAEAAS